MRSRHAFNFLHQPNKPQAAGPAAWLRCMMQKLLVALGMFLSVGLIAGSSESFAGSSGNFHYTYTYQPPWDAAHLYWPGISGPKPIARATKPFEPGCATETVTVPLGDGRDQTVNIVRCF